MDTYSLLREIADSWVLIALFAVFVGAVIFAFRPGSRDLHDDAANVPFRHEDAPIQRDSSDDDTGGSGDRSARTAVAHDFMEART